jgi:heme-degrading monooxygenase HmoA
MAYMLVRHKVKDFTKWKPVYDEHANVRKDSGSKGAHLFRNADNPNEVFVLYEWETVDKAKKFAQSENLRQKMQEAGVSEKPDIYFLNEVEQTPS